MSFPGCASRARHLTFPLRSRWRPIQTRTQRQEQQKFVIAELRNKYDLVGWPGRGARYMLMNAQRGATALVSGKILSVLCQADVIN